MRTPGSDSQHQRQGSACAAPAPRETNNYYSRQHFRSVDDAGCRGACYCPEDCQCAHKGFQGRYSDPRACDPCAIMDCCYPNSAGCCCCTSPPAAPKRPCSAPRCLSPGKSIGPVSPTACCIGSRPSSTRRRVPVSFARSPTAGACCAAQPCCPPYQPPARQPVCYPPVMCCVTDATAPMRAGGEKVEERICYYPRPAPCQPKYCTCGAPNPCDCDLNEVRRLKIAELAPCCRRCGRKVYAAEKIMASGGAFHSSCFSCYSCHKSLEVTNIYENQGEIYCKQCYAKYFGMSGYGYGSALSSPL